MADVSDVAVASATQPADDGASVDVLIESSLQHESDLQVRKAELEEEPRKLDEHVLFDANATEDSSPVGDATHWVETFMAELDTTSTYPESIESHVTPSVTTTSTRTESSIGPPGAGTGLFDDTVGVEPISTPDSAQNKHLDSGVPAVQFFYLDEVSSVSTTSEPAGIEGHNKGGSTLLWFKPEVAGATKAIDSCIAALNSKASRLRRKARKAVVAESPLVAKDVREDEDSGFTDEDNKRIAAKLRSSWLVLLGRSGGSRSKDMVSGTHAKPTENSGAFVQLEKEASEDVYMLSNEDVDDIAARIRVAQPELGQVTLPAAGKEADRSAGQTVFDAFMSAMSTKARFLRKKMHTIVVVELPHMTENARDLAAGVRHRAELAERDIMRAGGKFRERCLVLSGVSLSGVGRAAEDADDTNTNLADKLAGLSRRRKDLDAFKAAVSNKAKFIRSKGRTTILAPLLKHDAQEDTCNVDEGAETASGQPERLQSRLKRHWFVLFSGRGEHDLPVDVETAETSHGDKDSTKATIAEVGSRSMRAIKTDLVAKADMSKTMAQKMWHEVCKTKQDAVDDLRHGVDDFRQNIEEIRRALREIVSNTSEGGNRQADTAEPSISMVSPSEVSTEKSTSSMDVCLEVQVEGVADSASSKGSAPVTPTELQSQKDSGFLQQAICAASTRAGSEANSDDVEDVVSVKSGEDGFDQVESDGARDVAVV